MATVDLLYPTPANTEQYAEDLDQELGAPLPVSPATLAVTEAWGEAESPTFPGYNLLGTELQLPGASPDPSNPKVYDYPTLQEGLQAAVDELAGGGPQTNALDPQFVADVRKGSATKSQLISDVLQGDWDGSPDTYDADTISTILKQPKPLGAGSNAANTSSGSTPISTTSFDWNPLSWPGKVIGSAASSVAGDVGTYILKGVLTLMGAGLIIYGATLLTNRSMPNPASLGGGAGAAAGGIEEDPFELFDVAAA